jgi:hypothetical protein
VRPARRLPLWRDLPVSTYWTVPALVGAPIIAWALVFHPLAQAARRKSAAPSAPIA